MRLYAITIALFFAAITAEAADTSVVVTREFSSQALGRSWNYSIYLPAGYESSSLQYPTLYLLHGNGGNHNAWPINGQIQPAMDALIAAGEIPPAVVVMPDAGTSWYVDRKENMETAFIKDLLPDVERNFRVLANRNGRLIGGMSMGGYGALRFSFKYPDLFAAAGLFYPAIYQTEPPSNSSARQVGVFGPQAFDLGIWRSLNYPALWDAYLARKNPVPMFIVSGDDDTFFIESESTILYSLLRKNSQPAELRIVNGGHDWAVVSATINDALRYMFRYASRPAMRPSSSN